VEHHQYPRQCPYGVGEGLDLLASVDSEPDRDHRLKRPPERGEVDLCVEPPDDAAGAQGAEAGESSRRGDSNPFGEPLIGNSGVAGEDLEDRAIEVVHLWVWKLLQPGHRMASARIICGINT
jgi:hypothetical protein